MIKSRFSSGSEIGACVFRRDSGMDIRMSSLGELASIMASSTSLLSTA